MPEGKERKIQNSNIENRNLNPAEGIFSEAKAETN